MNFTENLRGPLAFDLNFSKVSFEITHICGGQLNANRAEIFLQMRATRCSWNRNNPRFFMKQPRKRDLCWRRSFELTHASEKFDNPPVVFDRLFCKARKLSACPQIGIR